MLHEEAPRGLENEVSLDSCQTFVLREDREVCAGVEGRALRRVVRIEGVEQVTYVALRGSIDVVGEHICTECSVIPKANDSSIMNELTDSHSQDVQDGQGVDEGEDSAFVVDILGTS